MYRSYAGLNFAYLNVGHFLDHFVLLIFASVAALHLSDAWQMSYAEMIPYATPGFVAFGLCSIPAGMLADRFGREPLLVVFFVGIGAATVLASFAATPLQLAGALLLLGAMASIYHPVGLAMVMQGRDRAGVAIATNGVFGNLGVACAALFTGVLIDVAGWRLAFAVPGVLAIVVGLCYLALIARVPAKLLYPQAAAHVEQAARRGALASSVARAVAVVMITTAFGGLIFQSTTFAMPKIIAENLGALVPSAAGLGLWTFAVLAVAGFVQLGVGYLLDRHAVPRLFALVCAGQALLFALMVQASGYAAAAVAALFMLLVFGQIPINDVIISRTVKASWRSRVIAIRFAVTFTVMASSVPLIAWLHARWGFAVLFGVLAACAAASCAVVFVLRNVDELAGRGA